MSFLRRLAILAICAVLLALSWWRSPLPPPDRDMRVSFTPIVLAKTPQLAPGLTLERAWLVEGKGDDFGGYSALASFGDGGLLALSDLGRYLRFRDPSRGDPQPRMGFFLNSEAKDKRQVDSESLTHDPETGRLWIGYEQSNAIVRTDAQGHDPHTVRPAAMRGWASNGGPEAMVRLADGRFIVLAESRDGWFSTTGPALLFPHDPVAGAKPERFRYDAPARSLPTDIAQLPDGRVLILHRQVVLGVPPGFASKLVLADPAAIRQGKAWKGTVIATLEPPLPSDNFEGLAVDPQADGSAVVWVISDDNQISFQRTILLKLRWKPVPEGKRRAREKGAR